MIHLVIFSNVTYANYIYTYKYLYMSCDSFGYLSLQVRSRLCNDDVTMSSVIDSCSGSPERDDELALFVNREEEALDVFVSREQEALSRDQNDVYASRSENSLGEFIVSRRDEQDSLDVFGGSRDQDSLGEFMSRDEDSLDMFVSHEQELGTDGSDHSGRDGEGSRDVGFVSEPGGRKSSGGRIDDNSSLPAGRKVSSGRIDDNSVLPGSRKSSAGKIDDNSVLPGGRKGRIDDNSILPGGRKGSSGRIDDNSVLPGARKGSNGRIDVNSEPIRNSRETISEYEERLGKYDENFDNSRERIDNPPGDCSSENNKINNVKKERVSGSSRKNSQCEKIISNSDEKLYKSEKRFRNSSQNVLPERKSENDLSRSNREKFEGNRNTNDLSRTEISDWQEEPLYSNSESQSTSYYTDNKNIAVDNKNNANLRAISATGDSKSLSAGDSESSRDKRDSAQLYDEERQERKIPSPKFFCREWVWAKLSSYVDQRDNNTNGSVSITGILLISDAGAGKTSVCRQLIRPCEEAESSDTSGKAGRLFVDVDRRRSMDGSRRSSSDGNRRASVDGKGRLNDSGSGRYISQLQSRLIAHHFCDGNDYSSLSVANFILSIVNQLSESNLISGYADIIKSDNDIESCLEINNLIQNPDEAFRKTIIYPLSQVPNPQKTCILLVDSIDEESISSIDNTNCKVNERYLSFTDTETTHRNRNIADMIISYQHLLPSWLFWIVTARKQSCLLTKQLVSFKRVLLDDLKRNHVLRDVQQYILCRLDREPLLRNHLTR